MKNRINFVLGARKILSVNALYSAKMTWVNGRQVATIYKTGEAKQTEAYIKEQVERLNIPVNYPWVGKDTLFRMTLKVVFRSGIFLKDLDNTFALVGLEGLPEYCWNLNVKKRNQQFRILYLKFNDYVQASFICWDIRQRYSLSIMISNIAN